MFARIVNLVLMTGIEDAARSRASDSTADGSREREPLA